MGPENKDDNSIDDRSVPETQQPKIEKPKKTAAERKSTPVVTNFESAEFQKKNQKPNTGSQRNNTQTFTGNQPPDASTPNLKEDINNRLIAIASSKNGPGI